jgi:hypothetical protein
MSLLRFHAEIYPGRLFRELYRKQLAKQRFIRARVRNRKLHRAHLLEAKKRRHGDPYERFLKAAEKLGKALATVLNGAVRRDRKRAELKAKGFR